MAEEATGGLQIHPMDQFIVKPLFVEKEIAASFDEAEGIATLSDGVTVPLSAGEMLDRQDGTKEFVVDFFLAGLQKIHWYTPTNVTLWMAISVLCVVLLLVIGTRGRAIVPSRIQSVAELAYGFVYKMVEDVAGKDGLRYFPYIMTLFIFIVFANFLGLIPTAFTTTSHIAVTATMALGVFFFVTVLGFVKHGAGFLRLFWIDQAPLVLRPILAIIEIISYFVRPVSHSIRLAGNMMAGHAVIKVFAGFAGVLGVGAVFPLAAITAVYALETLVAFIQAYVFAILTCVYLRDALHPHH